MPKSTKRHQFEALLTGRAWKSIGASEWAELRALFSEASLREWLREGGIPVEQPYRGVETKTLGDLEASLIAMAELYAREPASRQACRATVITAKDRTRFASRNPKVDGEKQALKAEMVEWMLVWLGDPGMFAAWAAIRKRTTT